MALIYLVIIRDIIIKKQAPTTAIKQPLMLKGECAVNPISEPNQPPIKLPATPTVSYTHLDVYKRQHYMLSSSYHLT